MRVQMFVPVHPFGVQLRTEEFGTDDQPHENAIRRKKMHQLQQQGYTIRVLAKVYGVTQERTRQLIARYEREMRLGEK